MRPLVYVTAMTAALTAALPALAQPPAAQGIRLEYKPPTLGACPDERDFRHIVAAHLEGIDPFEDSAPRRMSVTITADGQGFDGTISLDDASGQAHHARTHEDISSCNLLARMLATSIAQIFSHGPRPGSSPHAHPTPPLDFAPSAPLSADTTTPPPAEPTGPRVQLAAGAFLPIGTAPGLTAGFAAGVGIRWSWFSLSLEARGDLPRPIDPQPEGVTAKSFQLGGAIVPCAHYWWLTGCAIAGAAAIRIDAQEGQPRDAWGARVDLGSRIGLQVPIFGPISALASTDLLFAIQRHGIRVANRPTWIPPIVTLAPGLRILATF